MSFWILTSEFWIPVKQEIHHGARGERGEKRFLTTKHAKSTKTKARVGPLFFASFRAFCSGSILRSLLRPPLPAFRSSSLSSFFPSVFSVFSVVKMSSLRPLRSSVQNSVIFSFLLCSPLSALHILRGSFLSSSFPHHPVNPVDPVNLSPSVFIFLYPNVVLMRR
jgi:hypothetical protein